jgi:hypothetical protein
MSQLRMARVLLTAVVPRPRLWATAIVQVRRFVPDAWWKRAPFLPLPDPALSKFRSETQYGDPTATVTVDDLVVWLEWCRAERRRS